MATATKTTKTPAHDELAKFDEAIRAAEERRTDAQARASEQLAEARALLDADGMAFASGEHERAEQIRTERAALTEATETWQARLAAIERVVDGAKMDRRRYAEEHAEELLAELAPEAAAVAQRVEDILSAANDAILAYGQMSQRLNQLVHPSRHRPDPPALIALVPALERARGVPNPMPAPPVAEEAVA